MKFSRLLFLVLVSTPVASAADPAAPTGDKVGPNDICRFYYSGTQGGNHYSREEFGEIRRDPDPSKPKNFKVYTKDNPVATDYFSPQIPLIDTAGYRALKSFGLDKLNLQTFELKDKQQPSKYAVTEKDISNGMKGDSVTKSDLTELEAKSDQNPNSWSLTFHSGSSDNFFSHGYPLSMKGSVRMEGALCEELRKTQAIPGDPLVSNPRFTSAVDYIVQHWKVTNEDLHDLRITPVKSASVTDAQSKANSDSSTVSSDPPKTRLDASQRQSAI